MCLLLITFCPCLSHPPQIPAIRWRPALSHPRRRLWNLFHWWTGRAAVLLAVANIFYGLINVLDVSAGAWGAYTAVFSVIVAAGIAKDRCEGRLAGGYVCVSVAGWLAGSPIAPKIDMPALLLAAAHLLACPLTVQLQLPAPAAARGQDGEWRQQQRCCHHWQHCSHRPGGWTGRAVMRALVAFETQSPAGLLHLANQHCAGADAPVCSTIDPNPSIPPTKLASLERPLFFSPFFARSQSPLSPMRTVSLT